MKRTPLKRKSPLRKASAKGLKMKALLSLWSQAVLAAEGATCKAEGMGRLRCGGPIQSHHVYGKGAYPAMKYMVDNGIPVCRNHHLYWVEAQPPMVLLPWYVSQLGHDRLELLAFVAAVRTKMPKAELQAIMDVEREALSTHQGGKSC